MHDDVFFLQDYIRKPKIGDIAGHCPQTLTDIHRGLDDDCPLRIIARGITELIAVLPPSAAFDVCF
jgi:hypothetical protein